MTMMNDGRDGWAKVTGFAFALAMALVLARGMMLEAVRESMSVAPGQEFILRTPGAAVSVVLNFLSFLPAVLVALRAWRDERFGLRWTWSVGLLGAIGLMALLSVMWSDDRFAAAVSGGKLLAGAMLAWALAQCVRDWRQFRVVCALVIGLFAVNLVRSVVYVQHDLPAMAITWEQGRDELLAERGMEPGTFRAEQFERRVLAGELLGFNASPNTLAAIVAMVMVLLMGDLWQRVTRKQGLSWLLPLALMAGGAWMIWRTHSMTAMATPVMGLALLVIGWRLRGMLGRYRATAFVAGAAVVLAAWAAVIAHGMQHGTLLHRSLTFRWHYWTASWDLFRDNLLAGVGWENFAQHYLQYRLPIAPEEIRDPHNLFVRFATELGVIGLLLGLGWVAALAWEITRPTRAEGDEAGALPAREAAGLSPIPLIVALTFALVVISGSDFSQDVAVGVYDALWKGMYCFVLLGVAAAFAAADLKELRVNGDSAPRLALALGAGVAVYLVHNFIDFALFETGAFFLFMAATGSLIGLRATLGDAPVLARYQGLVLAKVLVLWLAFGVVVALPVVLGEHHASAADEQLAAGRFAEAGRRMEAAFEGSAWLGNAEYLLRKSRIEVYQALPPNQVARSVLRAIEANPRYLAAWMAMADLSARAGDVPGAIGYYDRAIALNPADVGLRLDAADAMHEMKATSRAAEQYAAVLELNALLPEDEPERLNEARESEVRARLETLRARP